ncbi:MAG TPA: NUDIX domain-containing protein [Chitinophagaceae bacterium]|nr:NUDIX domain-containing protein [Chitinophagaceae bacterium]
MQTLNTYKPKNINTHLIEIQDYFKIAISVDCVIFGFDENELKVLLIKSDLDQYKSKWSLLGDIVHTDENLEDAAYRVLLNRTGLQDVYLEQVHTFGKVCRHPAGRVVTIAYYSLINIQHSTIRNMDNELHWHPVKKVKQMAFDHREILDACYQRLQEKLKEHPVGFNLLPKKFSLRELQNLYEAILDVKLDRRNFRKKIMSMGLLIDLNEMEDDVPHRPAKLYKFDAEAFEKKEKNLLGLES